MLIKIKPEDGLLHFESDGDILSALIENLDELFISNDSMTFHYGDVDGSIKVNSDDISCTFTRESFIPWFACDELSIVIKPDRIEVYGYHYNRCIVHIVCVNG